MLGRLLSRALVAAPAGARGLAGKSAAAIVDGAVASPVAVFSKTYCPFCHRAIDALSEAAEAAGVEVAVVQLDLDPQGDAVQRLLEERTGQRTVPNVFVRGEHVGGCDDVLEGLGSGRLVLS